MSFNPLKDIKAKFQGYERLKDDKDTSQDKTDSQKTDGQKTDGQQDGKK